MYLAMDEIGSDNVSRLCRLKDKDLVWLEVDRIASGFGFRGIQFTPSLYEHTLGLSLKEIPAMFRKYRLTYHIGGIRPLASSQDEEQLEAILQEGVRIASENGMEDVSLHPPRLAYASDGDRHWVRSTFMSVLKRWLPRYADHGITLSVESHSSGGFFVFDGLSDFSSFVRDVPGLGVLVDISHLWNDGYAIDDVTSALENCRVTGLHLSDALAHEELNKGTHLPIGDGKVDFAYILSGYADDDSVYGALEIKAESSKIRDSVGRLTRYLVSAEKADH
jgi:sugar phosphate isomerase/epimerase